MNFTNEHREGVELIFFVDILLHNGINSNPIDYEITLTGLTAGELLFHSLCMHVQKFIDSL